MTVNPKSLTTTTSNPVSVTKSMAKVSKKIDMGAASNFGRDEIGINSPTHRNTHDEEDLFATSNTTTNKTDLLDDIFKTCNSPNNLASDNEVVNATVKVNDDFFDPRADDVQEFGDFASAFGGSQTKIQSQSIEIANETNKSDFADFAAFDTAQPISNTITKPTEDSANLLFAVNSTASNAQTAASNSNQKAGDLLSDLDGLHLNVSVPSGKFYRFSFYA